MPKGIYKILLSQCFLWESLICSGAWALLYLFCLISLILTFVCKGKPVHGWPWRVIKKTFWSLRKKKKKGTKTLKSWKGRLRDKLEGGSCEEIGYLQQSRRFFLKNVQKNNQRFWCFFNAPKLFSCIICRKQFVYSVSNRDTTSKGFSVTVFLSLTCVVWVPEW